MLSALPCGGIRWDRPCFCAKEFWLSRAHLSAGGADAKPVPPSHLVGPQGGTQRRIKQSSSVSMGCLPESTPWNNLAGRKTRSSLTFTISFLSSSQKLKPVPCLSASSVFIPSRGRVAAGCGRRMINPGPQPRLHTRGWDD